jgi:hypothetical protein
MLQVALWNLSGGLRFLRRLHKDDRAACGAVIKHFNEISVATMTPEEVGYRNDEFGLK